MWEVDPNDRRLSILMNAQLIVPGLMTFLVTGLVIFVLYGPLEGKTSDAIAFPAFFIAFFGTYFLTYRFFNYERWIKRPESQSIEELESQGLISATTYYSKRALLIEQFEDEGISYYLEIEDGHVLFLTGQYLDEYEYLEDEDQRIFPSTQFTVKRNIKSGQVLALEPAGKAFEPEDYAPPFVTKLRDGEIVQSSSFDKIKKALMDEPKSIE